MEPADPLRDAIAGHLSRALGAPISLVAFQPLGGGACQENHALEIEVPEGASVAKGHRKLVLRSDARRSLPGSIDRKQEFAVARAASRAGVRTPEPRWLAADLLRPKTHAYFLDWAPGVAIGRRILRDADLAGARGRLAEELAVELARIHTIVPGGDLAEEFPCPEGFDPVGAALDFTRRMKAELREPRPGLALALKWLEGNLPRSREVTLLHGDFRVGNFLVTPEGLSAVLDWEFAHWGCPAEDVAWIAMRNWRFGQVNKPVGGFARREEFAAHYARASGREVSSRDVHFWEVLANVRWAAGCALQGERYLSGQEKDIELIAIPRRGAEMEFEALRLIETGPSV